MKLLWDNYLIGSTVTASETDTLYPVSNLYDSFLEKKFRPGSQSVTVTIVMQETKTVSMIAYGYNNVTTSDATLTIDKDATTTFTIDPSATEQYIVALQSRYTLKDASGNVVGSGVLATGADINVQYITPVDCRTIEISFSSAGKVYIGGLAIGDPLVIDYIDTDAALKKEIRTSYTKTAGGQVYGDYAKNIRTWDISIPVIDNDKRLEMQEMIDSVGNCKTFFSDLFDEAHGTEKPMFSHIQDAGEFTRISHKNQFSTKLTISEAR